METIKRFYALIALTLISGVVFSQYEVGKTTITYQDPDRNNRNIQTVIFYPAYEAGTDVSIADGVFNAVIFGHGFAMANSDLYQYIWDALVPHGYIFLFPNTEGGTPPFNAPNHLQFALDLKFLNSKIQSENNNSDSYFYQKIADKTAIMGHSMGGKAAYIAAADNCELTVLISLAAAMSDPPWPYQNNGYDAMGLSVPYVSVPTLVVDAEFDCVVPDDEGHQHIYDALNTYCKSYVNILGGGHCYFASQAGSGLVACESGEGGCSSSFTISRAEQNQTVLDIITPYLNYWLKDEANAYDDFINYITVAQEVTSLTVCDLTQNSQITEVNIYDEVEDIIVENGTSESVAIAMLAQQISINDNQCGEHIVDLDWTIQNYNATVAGTYNAIGSFDLPAGVDQSDPPTDLFVTANVTVLVSCDPITIFPWSENFDDSTELPDCWMNVDNLGNNMVWQFGTVANGLNGTTGNYAFLNSDGYGSGNSQNADLISPIFDFSNHQNVNLQFTHYYRHYGSAVATLSYSINNGSDWVDIQSWTGTNTANPAYFDEVIPEVEGHSNVRFKWNFTGSYDWYWCIDDIMITTDADQQYTLTIDIQGSGNVNVDGVLYTEPILVFEGQNINIAANAEPGWEFVEWTGDLTGNTNPENIIMDGNKTVTANFTEVQPEQYTLTVNIIGSGTVNVDGAPYTTPVTVNENTTLSLLAIADNEWEFVEWTGDLTGNTNPENIIMDGNKTVTAEFTFSTDIGYVSENVFLNIFPNPANNFINIESGFIIDKIVIHDMLGKAVKKSNKLNTQDIKLNISDLNDGVYFIQVFSENEVYVYKIYKSK